MRRHLLTLALVGAFGALAASDASACCHKKQACPAPATCAAVAPAPVCAPAPVYAAAPACAPAPKKHCLRSRAGNRRTGGLCHKRQAATCAPVAYEYPAYAPVAYPSAQASPQASHQGY